MYACFYVKCVCVCEREREREGERGRERGRERKLIMMCIFVLCFFVFWFFLVVSHCYADGSQWMNNYLKVCWIWVLPKTLNTCWCLKFVFPVRLNTCWCLKFVFPMRMNTCWCWSDLSWLLVVSPAEFMSASLRSVHWFCCTWKRYHYQHIGSTALERCTAVSSLVLLGLKKVPLSAHWFYCTSERSHCQRIGSTALQRGSTVSALVLLHLEEVLQSMSHSKMKKAYDWTEVHRTECCMLQWQNRCMYALVMYKSICCMQTVYIFTNIVMIEIQVSSNIELLFWLINRACM